MIEMQRILHGVRVPIALDRDILTARQRGRRLAKESGFLSSDATVIATVISELARNMLRFAGQGEIILRGIENELTPTELLAGESIIVEIEHVPKRSSQLVERSAADLAGAPIILDEAEH